jgi:non-ribosomal peptide synthetase component F
MKYWKLQLADMQPLDLSTDRSRPNLRTAAGAVYRHDLPVDLVQGLARVGQRHDATLFMTLAAACQVLFHQWSGQDDITVGTVTAGRDRAELEGVVGFFANTLVLRSTVDGARAFSKFVAEVRETVL